MSTERVATGGRLLFRLLREKKFEIVDETKAFFTDRCVSYAVSGLTLKNDKEGIDYLIKKQMCVPELIATSIALRMNDDLMHWFREEYPSARWDIVVDQLAEMNELDHVEFVFANLSLGNEEVKDVEDDVDD